jgi:8-oxo-dGTP pyrophosphatase MutT (NUDIX family)
MPKTIIINEDIAGELKDLLTMTQFKFKSNIKKFLAALLEDPTGAEPDMIFTQNGLDKNKLIKALVDNKVITKKMTIDDHDAEGNPHTARMIVKYSVPKERFNERLDALYDMLFPDVDAKINESLFETDPYEDSLKIIKNSPLTMGVVSGGVNCKLSPEYGMGKFFDDAAKALNKKVEDNKLDEEGGGATSCSGVDGNGFGSGEFVQPLFGGITVRKKKDKKSVGGNPYTLSEAVTGEDGRKSSAVYAYAKNTNGEWCILAAKRNKNWDDEGGKMNPPMGHRHKYESPEDGAVRECEEESGIKFDKKDLVLASKEDWGTNFKIYLPGKTSDYKPGEGDEENTKFKWIPVSEIDNYDWAWSCGTFAKRFKPKK